LWYLKNIESHALMYHHHPGRKVAMVCDDNGDGVYWTGYVRNVKAPKAKAGSVAYIICFPDYLDEGRLVIPAGGAGLYMPGTAATRPCGPCEVFLLYPGPPG
jgi:hypothetical protein